jgi:hypothetical protein
VCGAGAVSLLQRGAFVQEFTGACIARTGDAVLLTLGTGWA